jgi:excisionase family DNA binding protein
MTRTGGVDVAQIGPFPGQRLLSSAEVAALLRVNTRTVNAWAKGGRLPYLRTIGNGKGPGHYRFPEQDLLAALDRARQETGP